MSFLLDDQLEEDDRLDKCLKNVFKKMESLQHLRIYDVSIKTFWAQSLRFNQEIEVRPATEAEHYIKDWDLIVMLTKDGSTGTDIEIEYLMAKELSRVRCEFAGQEGRPVIRTDKYDYNIMTDAIVIFGKDIGPDMGLFQRIKDDIVFQTIVKSRGMISKNKKRRNEV